MDFEIMDIHSENVTPTPTAPCSPTQAVSDHQPPLRERFGAAMTIIADTSPEIKALNLPITPTFPTGFEFGRSKSFSGLDLSSKTVLPRMTRAQSMRERVTFLIDQMEDVEAVSSSTNLPPCHQSTAGNVCYNEHRQDKLLGCLNVEKGLQHGFSRNRENIHPQLNPNAGGPNQQTPTFETPGEKDEAIKKPPLYSRRKSWHRRDSTASLPSPAEIAASPFSCASETPRQKNVSFCPSILPCDTGERDGTSHNLHSQTSQPLVPKSLHLTSGFR